MRRLFGEMRRRRVLRTAALYIVGTWLVMQVADVVFPALDIPERAIRFVLIAALLGFPAAVVFGWFYDVGMDGIRRTAPAGPEETAGAQPLRRSDYLILTALAGVVVAILYSALGNVIETPGPARRPVSDGPPMVAVLPFGSKGLEGQDEVFADGVHDDLLTQLAHIQSLRVISRTSVLEYKDTTKNIREIGEALGADAILEGSVQSADGRIRINAQLIDARTDEHLWAETYDRELSPANIFDVQADIARAIAAALRTSLTEQDDTFLKVIPTENMAAYRAYHQAINSVPGDADFEDPVSAFERVVAMDPTFTRAWAELVGSLSMSNFGGDDPELTERAEEALQKIREIAPASADYLIAQAFYTYYVLMDYDRALLLFSQAQERVPSDARLISTKAWIYRRKGNFEGVVGSLRQAQTIDPRDPRWTIMLLVALLTSHRYDDAMSEVENSSFDNYWIVSIQNLLRLREHGDFGRWLDAELEIQFEYKDHANARDLWSAYIANRDFKSAEALLIDFPESEFDPAALDIFSQSLSAQAITYWFQGQNDQMADVLSQMQLFIDKGQSSDGDPGHYRTNLSMALVAAAEGDTKQAERFVRRWRRGAAEDFTDLTNNRHTACRILGMSGAVRAAVDCIQAGLQEPSLVMPFMEPFLPYYDSLRQSPEFVELLAELDGAVTGR
jgi:TolB-like protein